ncbi:MAG: cob(I)yrinic acid a,c-diamide adenosyltransferase [candidate division FCPU426 bacterium]
MTVKRGFVHLYTGPGKGKTTAAVGLAVRALGAGWPVAFIQFLKGRDSGEARLLRKQRGLRWRRFGGPKLIRGTAGARDREQAQAALAAVLAALRSGRYWLVVADEILVARKLGLLTAKDVLACLDARPPRCELVLTGRGAGPALMRRADLVTYFQARKHYYRKDQQARQGIEF